MTRSAEFPSFTGLDPTATSGVKLKPPEATLIGEQSAISRSGPTSIVTKVDTLSGNTIDWDLDVPGQEMFGVHGS